MQACILLTVDWLTFRNRDTFRLELSVRIEMLHSGVASPTVWSSCANLKSLSLLIS